MGVETARRRFTLKEYHRMSETGILGTEERVELIRGDVVARAQLGSRHAGTVARLAHLFATRVGARAVLWAQNPLRLAAQESEPAPDLVLLAPRADFYVGELPQAANVRLLVEVADASLFYDRQKKLPLYARAGVPEAWLVNAGARRLEIHRNPGRIRYRSVRLPTGDETFAPAAFPDVKLRLRDVFG